MDLWISTLVSKSSTAHAVCGTDTLSSDGKPPCGTYSLAKNLGNEGLTDHSTQGLMTKGETSAQDTGSHQASSLKRVEIRRLCANV